MEKTNINSTEKHTTNPDPITKEPESHPVGTGVGAAGGAAAGAAFGSVAGPVGTLTGGVIGAIAGALAGHGVGEAVNPTYEYLIDFDTYDVNDNKVGAVSSIWLARNAEVIYVGIANRDGAGSTRVIPADLVAVSVADKKARLAFTEEIFDDAPQNSATDDLDADTELKVIQYFTNCAVGYENCIKSSHLTHADVASHDSKDLKLHEEKVGVRKKWVESNDSVTLKKIVRKEKVEVPVEVRKEELVIERKPASEATASDGNAFDSESIYISLREEEPEIVKQAQVKEVVSAKVVEKSDSKTLKAERREEDVEKV